MDKPSLYTEAGFTLVEVIISLFIFSLIATATIAALRIGLVAEGQLEESDANLREMQITRLLLKEDLAQIQPRPVRDEFGNSTVASFLGGTLANDRNFDDEERYLLRFTRSGWSNPDYADPRSSSQHVEYLVRGQQLIRRTRPFLDEAPDQPFTERVLLDDVGAIEVNFATGFARNEIQFINSWPVEGGNVERGNNNPSSPPLALQLVINTARYGELSQLFWVGRFANVENASAP